MVRQPQMQVRLVVLLRHSVVMAEQSTDGAQSGAAPVSRVIVMDQTLPETLAVRRVEIRRITIAPGYPAGLHVHNGPVFGSIETGSAVYQIDGEPETVLRPGDVFYEPADVRIARFDAQEDGVTFLGYFPLADGVNAELVFPASPADFHGLEAVVTVVPVPIPA
jgi:quercetin dioxygenase-like cupin family protein